MASLFDLVEPDKRTSVQYRLTRIVEESFANDQIKMQRITQAEVKRRIEITCAIFQQLRGDLSWGLERVFDHLPRYLRNELEGIPWKPDERKMWVPDDGALQ